MITDKSARTLILVLFLILYVYYKFVRHLINMKSNYNVNKCNPINLFIGGITGFSTDETFKQCAENSTMELLSTDFDNHVSKRQQIYDEKYKQMNNAIENSTASNATSTGNSANVVNATKIEVDAIKEYNKQIKDAVGASSEEISKTGQLVQEISTNFADSINNFAQSKAVTNI